MYTVCVLLLLVLLQVRLQVHRSQTRTALVRAETRVGETFLIDSSNSLIHAGVAGLRHNELLQGTPTADGSVEVEPISIVHISSQITTVSTGAPPMKRTGTLTASSVTPTKDQLVLDTYNIRIMPSKPQVLEGRSILLTCRFRQLLKDKGGSAPYMTFEFPPMSPRDKQSVRLILRPGIQLGSVGSHVACPHVHTQPTDRQREREMQFN